MPWSPPLVDSSELVPEGPWEYAMDVIAVHAKGDGRAIKESIGLETSGELWFYFADIISRSPSCPELNYEAPDLLQYREAAIFVKVNFNGSYAYCPFMYVDNDVSLVRGLVVGFPKKIASIAITRDHPLMKQKIFGATSMRAGYPLMKAKVEPSEECSSLPFDGFGPWLLRRYFPLMKVDEYVALELDVQYGEIKRGEANLEIYGGINDKIDVFNPVEIYSGYKYSALVKIKDVKILK